MFWSSRPTGSSAPQRVADQTYLAKMKDDASQVAQGASTRSNHTSRHQLGMARGQNIFLLLYSDVHQTPSKVTAGVLSVRSLPVRSSTNTSTRALTRNVRPQKGTISLSKRRPRLVPDLVSVARMASWSFTRTRSPGSRSSSSVGFGAPGAGLQA